MAIAIPNKTIKKKSKTTSKASIWNKDISFSNAFGSKAKADFYSGIHLLLHSGFDLKTALEIYSKDVKQEKQKETLAALLQNLIKGRSFSESLKQDKQFSAYEYYCVQIGEESGKLESVLAQLSAFFKHRIKLKKQISSALTYPFVIFFTAIAAVGFMLNFVVPMFSGIFSRFGKELPSLTQKVVYLSEHSSSYMLKFLLFAALLFSLYMLFRKKDRFKAIFGKILLKIPILGKYIKNMYFLQVCQSFALLLHAKTPLLNATQLVAEMIPFYLIKHALQEVQEELIQGKSFYDSLAEKKDVFEPQFLSLIRIGEQANKLDEIFEQLHQNHSEQLDQQTKQLTTLLEPMMIVIIGGFVAVILIAMYLPMFQMGTSIQ